MDLIRSRGHSPKEGYDVHDGVRHPSQPAGCETSIGFRQRELVSSDEFPAGSLNAKLRLEKRRARMGIGRKAVALLVVLLVTALALSERWNGVEAQQVCSLSGLGDGSPPTEVDTSVGPGTCGFLQFAWKGFLAMNWPAQDIRPTEGTQIARGVPDRTLVIGQADERTTVWEQYQPNWYLFSPNNPPPPATNGQSFAAWNQHANLPATCGPSIASAAGTPAVKVTKILSSLSKVDDMPGVGQAFTAPLIDQRGYYARYEIRFNYPTFNYVNAHQYYLASAQEGQSFDLPTQQGSAPGAILLKAAWKVLSPDEVTSKRFHEAAAFMYTPANGTVPAECTGPVTIGLVGLHIVQKTANFPDQIWSTFEHVDNTPDNPTTAPPGKRWSFFDPASTAPPNKKPQCPTPGMSPCDWQPASSHITPLTGPTQVTRLNKISDSPNQKALSEINDAVRAALIRGNPSSVWQFYRLVEAQWRQGTGFFPSGRVANVTMETYKQTDSCMACHERATAVDDITKADFTFELKLAWKP